MFEHFYFIILTWIYRRNGFINMLSHGTSSGYLRYIFMQKIDFTFCRLDFRFVSLIAAAVWLNGFTASIVLVGRGLFNWYGYWKSNCNCSRISHRTHQFDMTTIWLVGRPGYAEEKDGGFLMNSNSTQRRYNARLDVTKTRLPKDFLGKRNDTPK